MKRALLISVVLLVASGEVFAAEKYFPRYGSETGGLVEFYRDGFYVNSTVDEELSVYDCKKIGSLTESLHWGQCVGGEKFLFTLDPKHPETLKIGDAIYTECGQLPNC